MRNVGSIVLLVALLSIAAAWDIARRRVPNGVSVLILAFGAASETAHAGMAGGLLALTLSTVVMALLMPLWSARYIGGGEVKLGAATAAWMGWPGVLTYVLATALAGGVVACGCYVASRPAARAEMRTSLAAITHGLAPWRSGMAEGRVSVPYAVAIAAGGILTQVWMSWP